MKTTAVLVALSLFGCATAVPVGDLALDVPDALPAVDPPTMPTS